METLPQVMSLTGDGNRAYRPGGSAHPARAELDADPRSGRPGRLGDRVLPSALARSAHHQQIAVRQRKSQRCTATARPQREDAGGAVVGLHHFAQELMPGKTGTTNRISV